MTSASKAIVCSGTVNTGGATVSGDIYDIPGGTASTSGAVYQLASVPNSSPTYAQVRNYSTYTYNGQTCTADTLPAAISSAPVASASNPAHIFISSGNVNVTGAFAINGTLIVNGNLALSGAGTVSLTVTPMGADAQGHTFPAVIVGNQFQELMTHKTAIFNGLSLFQNGMTGSGTGANTSISINGALLLPTTGAAASYKGTLSVTYNAANASVPDLTTSISAPLSVRMSTWSD